MKFVGTNTKSFDQIRLIYILQIILFDGSQYELHK